VQLAQLLTRHGRGDEATEVLRALADSPGGAEDWIIAMLCTHYADQGRAEDGLAYLDTLKARRDGEDWDFFRMRLPLMVACGLREEAIELARAHPEDGTWYAAWSIAELLADAGRTEEAVAILEQHASENSSKLAGHLIDLGRVKDAVALLQQCEPRQAEQLWC
jgi:thioredoxin-like negative regulator of GroEL